MVTAIALSGGIDSLVAAFLLKETGADLIGIHFLTGYEMVRHPAGAAGIIDEANPDFHIGRISDQLSIPVHIVDIRELFKLQVVDYFRNVYAIGKTPNPCMVCNEKIKFGALLKEAGKLGADCLATGHYARITESDGRFRLLRGIDPIKDQSYFLAMLAQDQLRQARFPLGGMVKQDVRRLAMTNGLQPVSDHESQDICFIRDGCYRDFLESEMPHEPGLIVDNRGNRLGEHQGLHRYTIGQRRGINCPGPAPYYVLGLDVERNRLIVGFEDELYKDRCYISAVNWIEPKPDGPIRVQTRIRYRHRAADSTLTPLDGNNGIILFDAPQGAITPGQTAVCYRGDEVVAGGWIENTDNSNDHETNR